VLFTDIVGSTGQAAQLGDQRWRDLLSSSPTTWAAWRLAPLRRRGLS
jgi:class 3 adenylate cyclase